MTCLVPSGNTACPWPTTCGRPKVRINRYTGTDMTARRLENQLRRQRMLARLWKSIAIFLVIAIFGARFREQIESVLQFGLGLACR